MRRMARLLRAALVLGAIGLLALRVYTVLRYSAGIVDAAEARSGSTAIVFGAGLTSAGEPTEVLYDRVATAAELYRAGRVERLLLSGDRRSAEHDEPAAMRRLALDLGVPDDALVLDPGGLRTYDTCYRARHVYGVERAMLVTQEFHLPRALMLCDALGIDALGIAADRRDYPLRYRASWQAREVLATAAAWWDVKGP